MPVESKPFWKSKMVMMNLLMGLAMMISVWNPPIAEFIKTYFAEMGMGWSLLNMALRFITKEEVTIS